MNLAPCSTFAVTLAFIALAHGNSASAQFRAAHPPPPPDYVVTELPGLGTMFHGTHVFDVNDAGEAVGYAFDNQLRWRAVLWNPAGQVIDLGGANGAWSMARGISEDGVVGGFHGPTLATAVPVLWIGGSIVPLPDPPGELGVEVWDVNDALEAVGRGHDGVDSFATLWSGGACKPIAGPVSYAFAINERGTSAGFVTVDGNPAAARWDGDELIVLPDLGESPAKAIGINAWGTIVGGGASPIDGLLHAIVWDGPSVIDLGLYQATYMTTATGINDRDFVVGYYYLDPLSEIKRALLWTPAGIAHDLNDIDQPASGWTLEEATKVNDAGWIVGHGTRAGFSGTRGFVAKPR